MQFMRKYIHIAKGMKPILTRAASDYIAEEYAKLRNQDNLTQDNIARVRPLPIYITYIYLKRTLYLSIYFK